MVTFPETYNDPLFFGGGGGREGGYSDLSKFKGAVNLINLNILDEPVKTL